MPSAQLVYEYLEEANNNGLGDMAQLKNSNIHILLIMDGSLDFNQLKIAYQEALKKTVLFILIINFIYHIIKISTAFIKEYFQIPS